MSATAHLSDERLQLLVLEVCGSRGEFRVRDVVARQHCSQGNFSSWKNGKYPTSRASIAAARDFCDAFYATRALPTDFASTVEAPIPRRPVSFIIPEPRHLAPPARVETVPTPDCETAPRDLDVATWNVKNLGAATNAARRERLCLLLKMYDIVVLQEIRSIDVRRAFGAWLPDAEYGVAQTAPSGTAARSESTVFVWRRAAVELVKTRLCATSACRYSPALATFRMCARHSATIDVFSVHVCASLSTGGQYTEIAAICAVVKARASADTRLIVGDFNREPESRAFRAWPRELGAHSLLRREATTISRAEHCYDHIWATSASSLVQWSSGRVISLDDLVDRGRRTSRRRFVHDVSDHLPVVVTLSLDEDDST